MFIPGVGAFVRLKQHPATVGEDARVGLAGPAWGTVAAVGALALGAGLHRPTLLAIGHVGAWINLLPLWQLDGGRATTKGARHPVAGSRSTARGCEACGTYLSAALVSR